MSPDGTLYVADLGNIRIRAVRRNQPPTGVYIKCMHTQSRRAIEGLYDMYVNRQTAVSRMCSDGDQQNNQIDLQRENTCVSYSVMQVFM